MARPPKESVAQLCPICLETVIEGVQHQCLGPPPTVPEEIERAKQRRDKPWAKMRGEKVKQYALFLEFLSLGRFRDFAKLARKYGMTHEGVRKMGNTYHWYERAEKYDWWCLERQVERAKELREKASETLLKIEVDRQTKVFALADSLMARVERYLEWPIEETEDKVIEEREDGTRVIHRTVKPANWNMDTVVRMAQAVKDLYSSALEAAQQIVVRQSGLQDEQAVPGYFRLWNDEQLVEAMREDQPAALPAPKPALPEPKLIELAPPEGERPQ